MFSWFILCCTMLVILRLEMVWWCNKYEHYRNKAIPRHVQVRWKTLNKKWWMNFGNVIIPWFRIDDLGKTTRLFLLYLYSWIYCIQNYNKVAAKSFLLDTLYRGCKNFELQFWTWLIRGNVLYDTYFLMLLIQILWYVVYRICKLLY